VLRRQAEEDVLNKVIKSSGRGAKDLKRAVNNRLRKLVADRKFMRHPGRRLVREAVGAVLKSPDVLAVLRDIAHNFSASFKGASGNTPEDTVFIEELSKFWGKTGSQTARIIDLLNVYLLHHLNRKIKDGRQLRRLFKLADIKCVKAIGNGRDPSDAQYWARRGLKSVKQLFTALSKCAATAPTHQLCLRALSAHAPPSLRRLHPSQLTHVCPNPFSDTLSTAVATPSPSRSSVWRAKSAQSTPSWTCGGPSPTTKAASTLLPPSASLQSPCCR